MTVRPGRIAWSWPDALRGFLAFAGAYALGCAVGQWPGAAVPALALCA